MGSQSPTMTMKSLHEQVTNWTKRLKKAGKLIQEVPPETEPYKYIYEAVEKTKLLKSEVEVLLKDLNFQENVEFIFWINFTMIHTLSSIAKWSELCEELNDADKNHKECVSIIEETLSRFQDESLKLESEEDFKNGLRRCRFMLIYELTRYAILFSEREDQEKALSLLKRAEEFYHDNENANLLEVCVKSIKSGSILYHLNALNSESSHEMFTYVLFYLGQAYRIKGEKEKAVLYLHMVLRRQLEKKEFNNITWAEDTARMASVVIINMQEFVTARNILVAATYVLLRASDEEKAQDNFKQNWADLGRIWAKLGVDLLEASSDRLKDLEEQTKKPPKYLDKMKLNKYEKMSLRIEHEDFEFDTILLVKALNFPTLDCTEIAKNEMKGNYARDFDEARMIFLPLQKWTNVAKDYYLIDEFASDYVDIMKNYSNAFRHLAFFEPNTERQIKMHKRRIMILEDLVTNLNAKVYFDVCFHCLRELAEIYETCYKLKVTEIKDRGESLRPKDKKLVKKLEQAIDAHKRNLTNFGFDLEDSKKSFNDEYEKSLLGVIVSVGRILGSISHDHPLHSEAINFALEGKKYYQFFLDYLDHRPKLKEDFKVLYEGSREIPELMDKQIEKIKHRIRQLAAYR